LLALITIGVSLALYAWSREPRYLRFAWRVFLGSIAFVLVLMAFLRSGAPAAGGLTGRGFAPIRPWRAAARRSGLMLR